MDSRDVYVSPVLEIIAEALSIASLGRIIHLLMDRLVELSEHPGPVGVLIELRKLLGEFRYFLENDDVALDRRLKVWPLDLDGNLFTPLEPCAVDLAKGSGG